MTICTFSLQSSLHIGIVWWTSDRNTGFHWVFHSCLGNRMFETLNCMKIKVLGGQYSNKNWSIQHIWSQMPCNVLDLLSLTMLLIPKNWISETGDPLQLRSTWRNNVCWYWCRVKCMWMPSWNISMPEASTGTMTHFFRVKTVHKLHSMSSMRTIEEKKRERGERVEIMTLSFPLRSWAIPCHACVRLWATL